MTAPTTSTPTLAAPADHDELTHVGCCLSVDVALCGARTEGETTDDADCLVCLDLDAIDEHCPVRDRCEMPWRQP